MSHEVISGRPIWIDGYQFNNQANRAVIDHGADEKEATPLSGNTHTYAEGALKSTGIAVEGFFDASAGDDSIDKKLFDQIALDNLPIMIGAQTGLAGQIAYFMNCTQGMYQPQGQIGEVFKFNASAAARGDLIRGTVEINITGADATGQSTGRALGAKTADKTVHAALFVTSATGTLDVVVESDSNGSFTSPTSRLTFSQKTAIGSELLSLSAGAITDTYWRVNYTIGGGSPDFNFAVAIGIQ